MTPLLTLMFMATPTQDTAGDHELRLRFRAGQVHHVVIETSHHTAGTPQTTLRLELQRRVLEVKDQRARVELKLLHLSFGDNDPRSALFARLTGASWRGWIGPRGRFEALSMAPPKDLPALLRPLAKQLDRILPAQSIPLPKTALRLGDNWNIPATDLAASPDGSWAKAAQGGITCTLLSANATRATIGIQLDSHVDETKKLTGKGTLVVRLDGGWLESFKLKSRLHLETTIAGGITRRDVEQHYQLSTRAGGTP